MIEIEAAAIERISTILGTFPEKAKNAFGASIRQALPEIKESAYENIDNVYHVSKSYVKRHSNVNSFVRTDNDGIIGNIIFSGFKIPLYRFNIQSDSGGKNVRANLKKNKSPTPFKNAFIAAMNSGHVGIFERKGKDRFPIREHMGASVPEMVGNKDVLPKVEAAAAEAINYRAEEQISRILNMLD